MTDEGELRTQLEALHPASFGWALHCCGRDRAEAEDVLQTAYVKVLDGRARYGGRAAFKTWLFAVIRRTAADQRRRTWFRRLGLARYAEERSLEAEPVLQDGAPEEAETARRFRGAFAKLPWRQREVLHLVFYQGLTIEAAGRVMGVSLGSARTHYERGKQRLRGELQPAERAYET